jgi:polyphosphate:AMP phosphotransferase
VFEVAEVGRRLRKREFKALEPQLRGEILDAQFRARDAGVPLIVIVAGVEGAGKGEVVDRLNEWLDVRGVQVRAFWDETDEERDRPPWWRFWRALPPRGEIGVFFGSWYTRPIIDRVTGECDQAAFDAAMQRIEATERMLVADGAVVVKLWFHLPSKEQRRRLKRDVKAGRLDKRSPLLAEFAKRYDAFVAVSERALRHTDTAHAPWHVIEATDDRYRDYRAGQLVLEGLQRGLEAPETPVATAVPAEIAPPETEDARRTVLDGVDLVADLDDDDYRRDLEALQVRLHELAWRMRSARGNVVAVFEGWDAAGKGGAIRRVTRSMDARLYRTLSVAAPTDEERAHHYLWRFWRHLPMRGNMTLYDRSWYGRVLVERVEGFAAESEWRRAYQEINDFEAQLVEHGTVVLKFWLHISPEEQLERFRERERTPWKAHKITDEDWRNRERWGAYEEAVNEMVARTSTPQAPWTLVPANSKRHARVAVLRTFCERLEAVLPAAD